MSKSSRIAPDFPASVEDLAQRLYNELGEDPVDGDALMHTVQMLRAEVETREEDLARLDYLKARSIFETFEDVLRLMWSFSLTEDEDGRQQLTAHPPDFTSTQNHTLNKVKDRVQDTLTTARDEQLLEDRTQKLIRSMEKSRPHQTEGERVRNVSVQDLFLSPQALAEDIRDFRASTEPEKLEQIQTLVDPYLQFVDSSEDDAFTGLRLLDIWKYARYTWSIPFKQTPGRRMRYLIRDRSRDFHPIIGIGALGSGVMQLTPRDQEIGWAPLALAHKNRLKEHFKEERKEENPSQARMQALREADFRRVFGSHTWLVLHTMLRQLHRATDYLYLDDFYEEGVLSPGDIHAPSEETLERLQSVKKDTKNADSQTFSSSEDLEVDAQSLLYRRKRLTALIRVLKAKRVLIAFTQEHRGLSSARLRQHLTSEKDVRRAVKTALRSIKKRRIAGLMDITTCGALPPYNEILGGKLVSFLMASPQVISEYRQRYDEQESVIASRMKGETVVRKPELVLLSTTSLYAVGSSQYNRLDAPTAEGNLEYRHIGESSGHGHIHISQRTFATLVEMLKEEAKQNEGYERPGNRFGNGVNYRMRTISAALAHVGLRPLHQHEQPRLIYLVPLAKNWREYLTGKDDQPDYIYEDTKEDPRPETKALIDFWKMRWLYKRIQKSDDVDVVKRLEASDGKVKVSDLIPDEDAYRLPAPLFEEEVA